MTRWRTEAGTIDSFSNQKTAALTTREHVGCSALAQPSTSSYHTAAAHQRPRTGNSALRNENFKFLTSPGGNDL